MIKKILSKKNTNGSVKVLVGIIAVIASTFLLIRYFFSDSNFSRLLFKDVWIVIALSVIFLVAGIILIILGVLILVIKDERYRRIFKESEKQKNQKNGGNPKINK